MSFNDVIQMILSAISFVTLVILLWQTTTQNKLIKVQILKDKFDMYAQSQLPITDELLEMAYANPDRYMEKDVFEKNYKNDKASLRRFLYYDNLYQYFALRYSIEKVGLPSPNKKALETWIGDILNEAEFIEVHYANRDYFPEFGKYVDGLVIKSSTTLQKALRENRTK